MAREGRSANCAAGDPQLRPERDPRQRGAAARRQGDVRLGSARAAMHALDPHAEPISRPEPKPARERVDNGSGQARMAASRRVLLVEDEALVAMMIQQCLIETGHSIVGPISTASEALVTAKDGDFDAAILDI